MTNPAKIEMLKVAEYETIRAFRRMLGCTPAKMCAGGPPRLITDEELAVALHAVRLHIKREPSDD